MIISPPHMITPTLKSRDISFLGEPQNNSDTCAAFYRVCVCEHAHTHKHPYVCVMRSDGPNDGTFLTL